jgi:hypothetical protein
MADETGSGTLSLSALNQRNDEHYQEDDEQNPGDSHRYASNAEQAERAGQQRDEQKNQRIIKHKIKS